MKILVLTGSPHENGLSAALADAFCDGAKAAGRLIERFDAAKMTIHPCKGCFACHSGSKPNNKPDSKPNSKPGSSRVDVCADSNINSITVATTNPAANSSTDTATNTIVGSSIGTDANLSAGGSAITDAKNDILAGNYAKIDPTHNLCVIDDDMRYIWPHLRDCDVLVLVTPLYYFSFTAQLKTAIDRFFPLNETLKVLPKKACLLATCGNQNKWIAEGLTASYEAMCRHLDLEDAGRVISFACRDKAALQAGGYIDAARKLGSGLADAHH